MALQALAQTIAGTRLSEPGTTAVIHRRAVISGPCPGIEWLVDLPEGITAAAIVAHRKELAFALRLDERCVQLEEMSASHPDRVRLFVSDRPTEPAGITRRPRKTDQ
jgi:hypothetical protein